MPMKLKLRLLGCSIEHILLYSSGPVNSFKRTLKATEMGHSGKLLASIGHTIDDEFNS